MPTNFLTDPNNRQLLRMIVIAAAILIATFAATSLTGLLTSSKQSATSQLPPQITFQKSGNNLEALSFGEIDKWYYVGPRSTSKCDESLFQDTVVYGQLFKEGKEINLNYERDYNKHYCFKAVDTNGDYGFRAYHVNDLTPPIIIFSQTGQKLKASLSREVFSDDYTQNWAYALLENQETICSQTAFVNNSTIVLNNEINLAKNQGDNYYCFRLQKTDGSYIYQAKLIIDKNVGSPVVKTFRSGQKLYLTANQKIKDWSVVNQNIEQNCANDSFEKRTAFNHQNQIPIINLDFSQEVLESLCLRAQNEDGVYGYKKYDLNSEVLIIDITVQILNQNRLSLQAQNDLIKNWQVALVDQPSQCQADNFKDLKILSKSASIEVDSVNLNTKIYCWQAFIDDEQTAYALYILPPTKNHLNTYQTNRQIKGISLSENLTNWQWIKKAKSQAKAKSCNAKDFDELSPQKGQSINAKDNEVYCFSAQNSNNLVYYSTWTAYEKNHLNPSEELVVLANNLNLNEMGRFVLYKSPVVFYDDTVESQFQKACISNNSISCYNPKDKKLHLLKSANVKKNAQVIRRSFAQVIRWHYLTSQQREVQNFQLLMSYQQNKDFYQKILGSANFANRDFYEDEFLDNFYYRIVAQAKEPSNPLWQNYFNLFFN